MKVISITINVQNKYNTCEQVPFILLHIFQHDKAEHHNKNTKVATKQQLLIMQIINPLLIQTTKNL